MVHFKSEFAVRLLLISGGGLKNSIEVSSLFEYCCCAFKLQIDSRYPFLAVAKLSSIHLIMHWGHQVPDLLKRRSHQMHFHIEEDATEPLISFYVFSAAAGALTSIDLKVDQAAARSEVGRVNKLVKLQFLGSSFKKCLLTDYKNIKTLWFTIIASAWGSLGTVRQRRVHFFLLLSHYLHLENGVKRRQTNKVEQKWSEISEILKIFPKYCFPIPKSGYF